MTRGSEVNKALDRFFGVEMEAHPVIDSDVIVSVIKNNSNKKVVVTGWKQTHSNSNWHVKTDSTCGGGQKNGWEIVSYKAKGQSDICLISKVASELEIAGLSCGDDCGLHVHIDISDFKPEQVGVLLAHWIKIEKLMLESVPRRRKYSRHCRPIRGKISPKKFNYSSIDFWNILRPRNFAIHGNRDKKVSMNLVNYATCIGYDTKSLKRNSFCDESRKTVEFRFPEGTLCEKEIKNWIFLFLFFVENCSNKKMPEDVLLVKNTQQFFDLLGISGDCQISEMIRFWICDRIVQNTSSKKWRKAFEKNIFTTK